MEAHTRLAFSNTEKKWKRSRKKNKYRKFGVCLHRGRFIFVIFQVFWCCCFFFFFFSFIWTLDCITLWWVVASAMAVACMWFCKFVHPWAKALLPHPWPHTCHTLVLLQLLLLVFPRIFPVYMDAKIPSQKSDKIKFLPAINQSGKQTWKNTHCWSGWGRRSRSHVNVYMLEHVTQTHINNRTGTGVEFASNDCVCVCLCQKWIFCEKPNKNRLSNECQSFFSLSVICDMTEREREISRAQSHALVHLLSDVYVRPGRSNTTYPVANINRWNWMKIAWNGYSFENLTPQNR